MPNNLSKAAGNFFSLQNGEGVSGLKRKVLIIAQQLSTKDLPEERVSVPNAAYVGSIAGRGSVLHRLAIAAETGTEKQVDMFLLPQDEVAGGTAATGTATLAGTATAKGKLSLRIGGDDDLVSTVEVAIGDTHTATAPLLAAELVKLLDAPATFAEATAVITATAKNKGTYGNGIELEVLEIPDGMTMTISAMSGGATDPDIATALTAMANNDANDTDLIHGYDLDGTTLDKLSAYNGEGNEFDGLYQKEIAKPFRSLVADPDKDYSTITTFADGRKSDRTSGIISAPGCTYHKCDQAALVVGVMARINQASPAGFCEGQKITKFPVPAASERYWELGDDGGYSLRDAAVRGGVSPMTVIDGVWTLANINSFYHPDDVDESENGWLDMSDISISQNQIFYFRSLFSKEEWKGVYFVEDINNIGTVDQNGQPIDRTKIKDRDTIVSTLIQAAKDMASYSWLYNSDYTIDELQAHPEYVTIRANGYGFTYSFPSWYRLKGYIKDGSGTFLTGGSIAV